MSFNNQKLINLRLLFSVKCKTIQTQASRNGIPKNNNNKKLVLLYKEIKTLEQKKNNNNNEEEIHGNKTKLII